MFRILFTLCLLLSAAAAPAQTLSSRALTTSAHRDIAYFTQEVSLDKQVAVSARVAPLTVSNAGFGLEKAAVVLPAFPVRAFSVISVESPVTQGDALAAANDWMQAEMPGFQARVSAWLKKEGLSSAFFSYTQDIMVATELGAKKRAIAFSGTVDISGRPLYGVPKIVDPDPTVLEAIYVPLKALDGMPPTWQYPNAGQLRYRILNKRFEPLTDWKAIQTNGAFDEDPKSTNLNSKLNCLMDRRYPACVGPTDIKKLLDDTGATFSVVDYVRRLEPEYEEQPNGDLVAVGAISVDARIWDCTNYINKGFFGYKLTMRAERYLTKSTTTLLGYDLLAQFGTKSISPTEPYTKSVPISALGGANPSGFVINPNPGMNDLWRTSDPIATKSIIYIAPVTAEGGDGVLSAASFSGDMAVSEISSAGSVRQYYIGTVGNDYWSTGSYPRTVTFNVDNPQTLEEMAIIQEGFDDYLLVAVNGTVVFVGPYGGNMLSYGSGTTGDATNCIQSGAGWDCPYTTAPLPENENACPPGDFTLTSGVCYSSYTQHYDICNEIYHAGDSGYSQYTCSSGCPSYMVQWLANPTSNGAGSFSGCTPQELSTSWQFNNYIDVRPYLHSGKNEIFMHTIVYGGGEGWITMRTRSCGASLGLNISDPPPPPANASAAGVAAQLKAQ